MSCDRKLTEHFKHLATEARELYVPDEVIHLNGPPSPLEFQRDWVTANKPVIFKGCIDHWSALNKWNTSYLREKIGGCSVTVAVTPNGLADAVFQDQFVMPDERHMLFSSFLDIIETKDAERLTEDAVYYIQKQNSNLLVEFTSLVEDVECEIPWASEAFGKKPDAVNFWMGEERAVTSMHKDHYENLYCVISGEKHFILHPPTDLPFIPYGKYPACHYKMSKNDGYEIIRDPSADPVPWIPIDPLHPDFERWPQYGRSRPIRCTVKAGEMLYLPSLWFHHVGQSHGTIAVNFWYDMEFDIKYTYFKFLEGLVNHDQLQDSVR